jgi:ParB family transcriptional regulator, chromosome partitioning protein
MIDARKIKLADIDASDRLRPVNPDWAAAIAESFAARGQDEPIEVRPFGEKFKLTFGAHRLAAAAIVGWGEIDAIVRPRTERQARMAEIDENLIRHELTALDRAIFLAERKRLWEEEHPETKHGGDRKSRGGDQVANMATRFSAEVADKLGLGERTVQRACRLAELIDADTLEFLRRSPVVDNQAALFALLRFEPEQRRRAAKLLADGEAASLGEVRARLGLREEIEPDEALFRSLVSAWSRANAKVRRRFRAHIEKA